MVKRKWDETKRALFNQVNHPTYPRLLFSLYQEEMAIG
jgi:hypothetical protein